MMRATNTKLLYYKVIEQHRCRPIVIYRYNIHFVTGSGSIYLCVMSTSNIVVAVTRGSKTYFVAGHAATSPLGHYTLVREGTASTLDCDVVATLTVDRNATVFIIYFLSCTGNRPTSGQP